MAHDENDPNEPPTTAGPRVVPAGTPRPVSRPTEGSTPPPPPPPDRFAMRGRRRTDAARHAAEPEQGVPAWQRPPTTEPVAAPPPPPPPVDDAPADPDAADADLPPLPAGGWFRRRDADDTVEAPAPPPPPPPPPPPAPGPPPATEPSPPEADDVIAEPVPSDDVSEARPRGRRRASSGHAVTAAVLVLGAAAVASFLATIWPVDLGLVGGEPGGVGSVSADDRTLAMAGILGGFAALLVLAARWRGLRTVLALGGSFAAVAFVVLPALRDDHPPVAVAGTAAVVIAVVAGYLIHGFGRATSAALLGTVVGIGVTSGAGYLTAVALDLPGSDETRQLVAATVIIASVGVLLDLTTRDDDAARALSSAAVTLLFAFTGAALIGLLLASSTSGSANELLTDEIVAVELTRMAICGFAGMIALPISRWLGSRTGEDPAETEPST